MAETKRTLNQIIQDIELRFKSGNSVAIERAFIKPDEWEAIKRAMNDSKSE